MALTACVLPSQPPSYRMPGMLENVQKRPLQALVQQHDSLPTFFAAKSEQGRRTYQEDAHVQVPCLLGQGATNPHQQTDFLLAAVFDGHGGPAVAKHCQATLPAILRSHLLAAGVQHQPAGSTAQQAAVESALIQGFSDCDHAVPEEMASEGGSTALLALVGHHMLHIAHCGDSRAIVVRAGGEVVPLTDDHKPERPDEMERIKAAGGHVFWNGGHRVMGVLSMSRAIGDMYLKRFGVIATPEVKSIPHTPQDLFLLLASDGLWGVMSNEQAGRVARTSIARALARGADRSAALRVAAQVLVKAALAAGSNDNVTVVLVEGKALPALESALHAAKARAVYSRSRSAPSATAAAVAVSHTQQQQQAGAQQPHSRVAVGDQELRGTLTGGLPANPAAHLLLVDGIDSGMDLDAPFPAPQVPQASATSYTAAVDDHPDTSTSNQGGGVCGQQVPRWVAVEEVEDGSTEELMVRLASGEWAMPVEAVEAQQQGPAGLGTQAAGVVGLLQSPPQHLRQQHTPQSWPSQPDRPPLQAPATPGGIDATPLARPQLPLQVNTAVCSFSQEQPAGAQQDLLTNNPAAGGGSPSLLSPGAQMSDLLHMPSLRSVSVPHARLDDSVSTPVAAPGAGSWPCTPSNVATSQTVTWPSTRGAQQGDSLSTPGGGIEHNQTSPCCITPLPVLAAAQARMSATSTMYEKGGHGMRPSLMLDPATERLIVAVPQAE